MSHSSHADREREGLTEIGQMVLWWTVGMVVFVAFLFALGALVTI